MQWIQQYYVGGGGGGGGRERVSREVCRGTVICFGNIACKLARFVSLPPSLPHSLVSIHSSVLRRQVGCGSVAMVTSFAAKEIAALPS